MYRVIIYVAIILSYYIICGLATTNILRLTAGNKLPVRDPECLCDNCNKKISPFFQLPIISFILCKGRCRNCNAKIPVYPLILEIGLWTGMSCITAVFKFSYSGILFSFLFYEIVRVVLILCKGKRETDFGKQYLIAVVSIIPFLLCVCFISFLLSLI